MADIEIRLDDSEVRRALEIADPTFRQRLWNVMGDEAVDALQAPDPFVQGNAVLGSSGWPVDTGLSKSSFDYHLNAAGIVVTNDADYAEYVEERTGAAESTLRANLPAIAQAGDAFVQKQLDGDGGIV